MLISAYLLSLMSTPVVLALPDYVHDQVLVQFKEGVDLSDIGALEDSLEMDLSRLEPGSPSKTVQLSLFRLFPHYAAHSFNGGVLTSHQSDLMRYFLLKITASFPVDSAVVARTLNQHGSVAHAEVNWIAAISAQEQKRGAWIGEKRRSCLPPETLAQACTNPGIAGSGPVAVLDTGVDLQHPKFAGRIWRQTGPALFEIQPQYKADIVNDDAVPLDNNGHGTHVAGIVVDAAPQAEIMVIKVLNGSGRGSFSDIARGVDSAFLHGSSVICMSFASTVYSPLWDTLFEMVAERAILVAGAGNRGMDLLARPYYPAAHTPVLGVEALDSSGVLADFSNSGYEVAAPGVDIENARRGGGTIVMSGTSMAAPGAAGLAARLSVLGLSAESIRQRMRAFKYHIEDALDFSGPLLSVTGYTVDGRSISPRSPLVVPEQTTITIQARVTNLGSLPIDQAFSLVVAEPAGIAPPNERYCLELEPGSCIDLTFQFNTGDSARLPRLILQAEGGVSGPELVLTPAAIWPQESGMVSLQPDKRYLIRDQVTVNGNLFCPENTRIFYEGDAGIEVANALHVMGTEDRPVRFEPAEPEARWQGIRFASGSTGTLEYAHFKQNGPALVETCVAAHGHGCNVRIYGCRFEGFDKAVFFEPGMVIERSTFIENRYAVFNLVEPSAPGMPYIRGNTFIDNESAALHLAAMAYDPRGIRDNNFFKSIKANPLSTHDVIYEEASISVDLSGNFWEFPAIAPSPEDILALKATTIPAIDDLFTMNDPLPYFPYPIQTGRLSVAIVQADGNSVDEGYPIVPGADLELSITLSADPMCQALPSLRIFLQGQGREWELASLPGSLGWQADKESLEDRLFAFGPTWLGKYSTNGLPEGVFAMRFLLENIHCPEHFPYEEVGNFFLTLAYVGGISRSLSATKDRTILDKRRDPLDHGLGKKRNTGLDLRTMPDPGGKGPAGSESLPVRLNWRAQPGERFHIYRTTVQGQRGERLNTGLISGGSFLDYDVVPGQDYGYSVRSVDTEYGILSQTSWVQGITPSPGWQIGQPEVVLENGTLVMGLPTQAVSPDATATLFYRPEGELAFSKYQMKRQGDLFRNEVPNHPFMYYIRVIDQDLFYQTSSSDDPHRYPK